MLARDGDVIVTGRVLPEGDRGPSPRRSTIPFGASIGAAGIRPVHAIDGADAVVRAGVRGFRRQFRRVRRTMTFSYRWLRAGRRIRYEPDFLVCTRLALGRSVVATVRRLRRGSRARLRQALAPWRRPRRALRCPRLRAAARGLVDRATPRRRMNGDWRVGLACGTSSRPSPGLEGVPRKPCRGGRVTMSTLLVRELAQRYGGRRRPRATQFDYLHVRRLVNDVREAISRIEGPVEEVLDVYCGCRPYDDLLPPGARSTGLDIVGNLYGVADVTSDEFLPFADASFDLVTCYEAFHYVEDPRQGVDEIRRVLRPGARRSSACRSSGSTTERSWSTAHGPGTARLVRRLGRRERHRERNRRRGQPDGDVARTGTGAYPEARWRTRAARRGLGPLRGHERCSGRPRPARPQIRRQRSDAPHESCSVTARRPKGG